MPFGGLATAGIGAGISLLGGLFNRKPQKTTTDTTPTYTAAQSATQGATSDMLAQRMTHPNDYLSAQKASAMGGINQQYSDIQTRMNQSLSARGFGNSGVSGSNLMQTELGRAGAQSELEGKFAAMQQGQDENTLRDAMQFSFANPGSHQVSTGPAGTLGGAVQGGLQTGTFLYALQHMMNGGGAQAGGGQSGGGGYD